MTLKKGSFLIIALLLIFLSCTTTTSVKMLKPAKLNIGPVKTVAVMDFEMRGSWEQKGIEKTPNTLKQLGLQILTDAYRSTKKQETPLDPMTAYPGTKVSNQFIAKLVNNGHYTVIEREKLEQVIEEQKLALSGMIDESTAAEIGQLVGAEALILGAGDYSVDDEGEWHEYEETYKDKEGKKKTRKKKRFRITRKVNVNLNLRFVNTTTGEVTVATSISRANYKRKKSIFSFVNTRYSSEGKDEEDAIRGVPAWRPIVDGLVNQILNEAVTQIAPHYIAVRREILGGDSKKMKNALEYAKRGLWDDARPLWEQVIGEISAKKEDRTNATYNMGLYMEVNGMLDEAEEYYDKSFKMSGESKFLDAKARIKKRKAELKRLEEQTNGEQ